VWIERSGSSIDYAADLIRTFPEAHVVHIHRAGEEVALSMREHHAYRLPISLLYDAPLDDGARVSTLPPLDFDAPPTPDDTISRILRARPPAEYFGRYWSDQIVRGMPALRTLPAERLLEVSFEALLRSPASVLQQIPRVFALGGAEDAASGWIHRAAALVRGAPASRAGGLPADERARLLEACAPGRRALGMEARA
jgi:putative sulfotransferase